MYIRKVFVQVLKFFALMLFTTIFVTQAAELPKQLRFGIIDLPPFGCDSPEDQPGCFQNQLVIQLEQEIGIPIKVLVMPYPRVLKSVQTGSIDFLMTLDIPVLREHADIMLKVADLPMRLYRHKNSERTAKNGTWRLGLLKNAYYGEEVNNLENMIPFPVLTFQQSVSMFAKHRLDGVVGPAVIIDLLIETHGIKPSSLWEPIPAWNQGLFMYCRKDFCRDVITNLIKNGLDNISPNVRKNMLANAVLQQRIFAEASNQ